jgi:[acyl-carrier-protein] S-malonyltransferase
MRAVVGLDIDRIEEIVAGYRGDGVVTAANHNTPEQTVLAGSPAALAEVCRVLEEMGTRVVPLNVSIANHTPLMAGAVPDFAAYMADIPFSRPKTPVYFNITGTRETEPVRMKDLMARQIVARVHWCSIIQAMFADGVDTFIEIGPKTVLKGMIKKIAPKGSSFTALQFDTPAGLEQCLAAIAAG